MKYSSFRLEILNLLIGLCRGSPGLPATIRQMGYRDRWIPGAALGSQGAGADPVLVLTSTDSRHSVFVQVMPGPNVNLNDLDRYSKVSAVQLREKTPLTRDQTELYGVAVFGLEEHRESLRDGIGESRIRPTLLLRTREGLVIDANPFPKVGLAHAFRPVLALDWDSVPLGWVPYDHGSHPAEIARAIIPLAVARATGERRVGIAGICAEHPMWSVSTAAARRKMRRGVGRVLTVAAKNEFRDFFEVRDGAVLFSDLAREAVRQPGSPTLKRMLRHQGELLERLQDGVRG